MKRRRPVLDVGLTNFADSNALSAAPILSSSGFSNESDISVNAAPPINNVGVSYSKVAEMNPTQTFRDGKPYTSWQMCTDENTGYTYYWNVETNQVTWEMPPEYLAYETALEQNQLVQTAPTTSEIHPLIKHKIARTTQEVIANRNSVSKKLGNEGKPIQTDNNQTVLVPYGPAWEDDGYEDAEARKIASARKRLLSYKSDKLKQKSEDSGGVMTLPDSYSNTSANINIRPSSPSAKTEAVPCKIPFVPTPDEIKEHPIFSNFNLSHPLNNSNLNSPQFTKPFDNAKPSLVAQHYYSDEESEDNDDEHSDDVIITRLRKKALMLQELGGDVPKEIRSILDDSKTAKDIIAEIEKEIPPDANDDDSLMEMDIDTDEETENPQVSDNSVSKPVLPILDHGKGSEKNESKIAPRTQAITRKAQMKNIQKIKLSARARELIKTSLLTAKARATNFVETVDGLKPAEEVLEHKKEVEKTLPCNSSNGAEVLVSKVESVVDHCELAEERRKREGMKRIELDVTTTVATSWPNESSSKTTLPCAKSTYSNFISAGVEFELKVNNQSSSMSLPPVNGEGLVCSVVNENDNTKHPPKADKIENRSVKSESVIEKPKEDMFGFQSSFIIPNAKRAKIDDAEAKKVSLVSKCEEFLQSVKKNVVENETKKRTSTKEEEKKNIVLDVDIDAALNTKQEDEDRNVMDFSQLIMEKLKFLNDGKSSVTPVQVMAIQIETLIGAWQSKALTSKYLEDWLKVSSVHLKDIEEAAAPKGWQCEWDRSYGRYYYRNKSTGTIQWDFPETALISSTKRKHRPGEKKKGERPKTPPPPTISKPIMPPPPPIISELDMRNTKPVNHSDLILTTEYQTGCSSPLGPPIPILPLEPAVPPLPPPSLLPPPPPPPPSPPELPLVPPAPPVISEASSPSVDCTESKVEEVISTQKCNSGLHDELNSFYSDIASIESTLSQNTDKSQAASSERSVPELASSDVTVIAPKIDEKGTKKKKKVKLDSTLSLKKKGLEGLVAKWQKVNSDI